MNKIVIVGGYGAVGREAASALVRELAEATVVVAGRNPAAALPVHGTTAVQVDVADPHSTAHLLDGADAVLMCAEVNNVPLARACLERGIHYLDVTASAPILAQVADLDALARAHHATAVLSVGLAPGVTNLLAAHCVAHSGADEVRIGIMAGAGERHGPAALRWTLDGLGELPGAWAMDFPGYGRRTVYRMPFSDQYTLPGTLGVAQARTGLSGDSRALTTLLAAARWPVLGRVLRHRGTRAALLAALTRIHFGSDAFAVAVQAGNATAAFSGHRQSRATGLAAALLIQRLPGMPAGVRHIEEVVDPVEFLTELAGHGFALTLASHQITPR